MESFYCYFKTNKFTNRGFLIGPYCPIYGFGVILIILLLTKYKNDPIILFAMSIIICSILEYMTSLIMELLFKNRWWDYSNRKFNINGRICLETMIPFGIIGTFVFYILNPSVIYFVNLIPNTVLIVISIILLTIILIDLSLSFNIVSKTKGISKNIKIDSTDEITKKVREVLLNKSIIYRRIAKAFPNMKIKLPKIKK